MDLTQRQRRILDFIEEKQSAKRLDIESFINSIDEKTSKVTIIRDLDVLLNQNLIKKTGQARSITYLPTQSNELLRNYNIVEYFKVESDNRKIKYSQFNFGIFNNLNNIFTKKEILELENTNNIYRGKIEKLSPAILKKEFERLLIELSWKSSQIEGNTYSLLDTEVLIKDNIEAEGHKKEEAIMILNHKKALEYIFENGSYFKELTLAKVEELHAILVDNLNVIKGLRTMPVGIVGTNYKPLFNQHQIKEAIEKLIEKINSTEYIIEKALIAVLMISYIQPFEDGNKRTSRLLCNAILLALGCAPLSYRSVDENNYRESILVFYEKNSLIPMKNIFIEQYIFSTQNYLVK